MLDSIEKKNELTQEIHDGFIYHIKVIDGEIEVKSVFDDHSLPDSVCNFMDAVRNKNEGSK